jgi:branched-chain amino acid transport system permease protein
MYNWTDLTNGPHGMAGIPKPVILGSIFATHNGILILYGIIATSLAILIALLKQSPFGRSLQAMRDDELATRSLGISVKKLKIQSFFIASALVGIAGGMYAAYVSYIDPTSFTIDESILMLSMVIVGGTGNIRGPIIGAAVLIAIPEILRLLALPDEISANLKLLAYGLLLILMMHLRPQGLAGKYRFE